MNNKDCKIVRDLLPNYIEQLTSEETNNFIENHLAECKECKETMENMKEELKINATKIDKKEVKYIKKYNIRLRILTVFIIAILLVALGFMTYCYAFFRNSYFSAANLLVEANTRYPDVFYATIEEIEDTDVYGRAKVKIKGLNVNDSNHRGEYYFYLDYPVRDDETVVLKIKFQETEISWNDLKVGQTIAVYNYGDTSVEEGQTYLGQVNMIIVLDDEL